MIKIDNIISYIPASESPLSADIGVIKGSKKTWLFDVGASDEALNEIQSIDGEKVAVISHFHPDHMSNLSRLPDIECYVGSNTFKYSKRGIIVDSDLYIEDGAWLHLFPIPSSHAKGSLGLEVNEKYAFIGDATAPTTKARVTVYNAQKLYEEIKALDSMRAKYILQSHRMNHLYEKQEVVEKLKRIYAGRKSNEPFIICEEEYD